MEFEYMGRLRDAAEQGSIDALYALIQMDAKVLDRMDDIPFVETPLHIAASAGHTRFAMEVIQLKPSFARKLNQCGFSPMHLALQKLHHLSLQKLHRPENNPDFSDSQNNDPLQRNLTQLVHRLLDVDKDLVRVQGREGVTPLHYVAQTRNKDQVKYFLSVCPESIEDVTIRRETVLHIALNHNADNTFRFLLSWLRRACFKSTSFSERKLLNWQDEQGNTVLHIAVTKNKDQIVKLLLDGRGYFRREYFYYAAVDINAKNLEGRTALGMLEGQTQIDNREIKNMLCRAGALSAPLPTVTSNNDFLKSPVPMWERLTVLRSRQRTQMTNEVRNILLVVLVLFVTVTYQAALNPPPEDFGKITTILKPIRPIAQFGSIAQSRSIAQSC